MVSESADRHPGWWAELRRRDMFHVLGLYFFAGWVIVQLAEILSEGALPMPPEAHAAIWLALFLAFPVVLVFGWRYDITGNGIV